MFEPEGLGSGPAVTEGLEKVGLRRSAFIWRWHAGAKGGEFAPHLAQNGIRGLTEDDFDGHLPRQDVNGEWCMCMLQAEWRDERGRFAPAGGEPMDQLLRERIKTARTKLKA